MLSYAIVKESGKRFGLAILSETRTSAVKLSERQVPSFLTKIHNEFKRGQLTVNFVYSPTRTRG
jgi:hypothetical protein